jgi:ribonuclease VapC
MIVDSSALVAIVKNEPKATACAEALERAPHISISAANYLEASIVVDALPAPSAATAFEIIMEQYGMAIEPVTESQARIARLAYRQYGRGNDSKAKLNFGDCFAYALARERNEPLLFTGDDFTHTDIRPAIAP